MGFDGLSLRKRLTQEDRHERFHLGTDTTAIKIYSKWKLGCQNRRTSQLLDLRIGGHQGNKFLTEDSDDFLT